MLISSHRFTPSAHGQLNRLQLVYVLGRYMDADWPRPKIPRSYLGCERVLSVSCMALRAGREVVG